MFDQPPHASDDMTLGLPKMLRGSVQYVAALRGATIVIYIPGHVLLQESSELFSGIMDDISLAWLLGCKIVIVVGVKEPTDAALARLGIKPVFVGGYRLTDEETLQVATEVAGYARFQVEKHLCRGVRYAPDGAKSINVVSGNLYTAQPRGVVSGVDFMYTGQVRRIQNKKIEQHLDTGDIVLLTNIGFSATGEVYNVTSLEVATECAAALGSDKLVVYTHEQASILRQVVPDSMEMRRSIKEAAISA